MLNDMLMVEMENYQASNEKNISFISSQLQIAKVEMDVERFRVSVQWLQHPEQGDKD